MCASASRSPRVVAVSVTEAGRRMAAHLPYEHCHGSAGETVRSRWGEVDGLVLFMATGAAVRLVAPLLTAKDRDPAVVAVDEAGRFAVALVGGHAAGANALCADVAAMVGATAVVTTATDAAGMPALDQLPGWTAHGATAAVTRALLDRAPVSIGNETAWPLPDALTAALGAIPSGATGPVATITVDDRQCPGCTAPGTDWAGSGADVVLHPPALVLGVGCSTDAGEPDIAAAVAGALQAGGLSPQSVTLLATIDRRAGHRAVTASPWPVAAFSAQELRAVIVPNPSPAVQRAVGTPSVAEAAALLAAGPRSTLVVPKWTTARATAAVARRAGPTGSVTLVGLGPGDANHRTPEATAAVRHADAVVGYGPYVDQCAELLSARQRVVRSPIGAEIERAQLALELALGGSQVAMVCSGDAGVYAMASPLLELRSDPRYAAVPVTSVPGVTAAAAAAAVLGAPLGHDHAFISLSDLLTPWAEIERRIAAVADSDLVVAFYNPRSRRRHWQLDRARQLLLAHRSPATPVGVVTDAGRPTQVVTQTTLAALDPAQVTMTSCVVVGSSATTVVAGRMVTPRGYRTDPVKPEAAPEDGADAAVGAGR